MIGPEISPLHPYKGGAGNPRTATSRRTTAQGRHEHFENVRTSTRYSGQGFTSNLKNTKLYVTHEPEGARPPPTPTDRPTEPPPRPTNHPETTRGTEARTPAREEGLFLFLMFLNGIFGF